MNGDRSTDTAGDGEHGGDDIWGDSAAGVGSNVPNTADTANIISNSTGPDSNGCMVIDGVAYCGETADVLEARKIAEEANRLVFIAQMRARFELDQEQAELENRQKNG